MSEDYLRAKIKEAMDASCGERRDAQKLLITWAVRDPVLLLGLTKPHLKAIVAARIDQAGRPSKASGGSDHFSKSDVDAIIASRPLGEKRSPVVPPPKSSTRQASVMHQLAAAFRKRK